MAGKHKTAIIVESGMVVGVYSTLPSNEHEIELIDLDTNDGDTGAADEIKARADVIETDLEYHKIYG